MAATKGRLKVVKTNGTIEEYLHTKVIGTISNGMSCVAEADITIAEHLAEVVTYFLYHKQKRNRVTSSEIFSMIKVILSATGHEDAAIALSEHYFERKLKRSRVEFIPVDVQELADAELLLGAEQLRDRTRWDKSIIVNDLVQQYDVGYQTARAIASMVEEKIFNIGLTSVSGSLVKQLVLGDAAAMLQAERQLQTV